MTLYNIDNKHKNKIHKIQHYFNKSDDDIIDLIKSWDNQIMANYILHNQPLDDKQKSTINTYAMQDKRNFDDLVGNMVISWIVEDLTTTDILSNGKRNVEKNGCDNSRIINSVSDCSNESDILINGNIHVELVADYTGFCEKSKKYDLRYNKLKNLIKESEKQPVFLMILLVNSELDGMPYLLIDISDISDNDYQYYYNDYWHKPCYRLNLSDNIVYIHNKQDHNL